MKSTLCVPCGFVVYISVFIAVTHPLSQGVTSIDMTHNVTNVIGMR
jgi:hypothetical protein